MFLPGQRKRLRGDSRALGVWGQNYARSYLLRRGYGFVGANYHCSAGEIDLIMSTPEGSLVFVEVKTRSDESFASAESSVNYRKQQKIRSASKFFIKEYGVKDRPLRFDVVALVLKERGRVCVRHYERAFSI